MGIYLLGIIMMIIGSIQLFTDFGWLFIIKENRSHIATWKESFNEISKLKAQKIFLAPIIMDLLIILISITFFTIKNL